MPKASKKRIKRDRKVRSGHDVHKIAAIWKVLADENGWLHVAEIARRANLKPVTVLWYLDHYFRNVVDEQRPAPTIRIRMVRLKPGADFAGFLRALELIRSVKKAK
jgi:hypothetical protein